MSMIIDAAKSGDVDAIRRILRDDPTAVSHRADNGETPLMAALYRGHSSAVEALIGAGAPLDLFSAAATGRMDVVDAELQRGAAVSGYAYDGWTPLHLAGFFGHTEVARRLLEAGAAVNAVSQNALKNTPLHAATAGKHEAAALLLIERGGDVNAKDAGGHTPLHIAAENGLGPIVRALLASGADPHAVDVEDKTPLSRAAAKNHNHIVDLINDPD